MTLFQEYLTRIRLSICMTTNLENTVTVVIGRMAFDCPVSMNELVTKSSMIDCYAQNVRHINERLSLSMTLDDFALIPKPDQFEMNSTMKWSDYDIQHQGAITMVVKEDEKFPQLETLSVSDKPEQNEADKKRKSQKKRAKQKAKQSQQAEALPIDACQISGKAELMNSQSVGNKSIDINQIVLELVEAKNTQAAALAELVDKANAQDIALAKLVEEASTQEAALAEQDNRMDRLSKDINFFLRVLKE